MKSQTPSLPRIEENASGDESEVKHEEGGSIPAGERPVTPVAGREVASSIYEQSRFDYLRLDDLGPFVRAVRNQLDATSN